MTNARLEIINDYDKRYVYEIDWGENDWVEQLKKVNEIK